MSSLVSQMVVFERYGARLNVEQLAEVLGVTKGALYNQFSSNRCPVKTYVDAGKRWADFRDVAAYLDSMRALAA